MKNYGDLGQVALLASFLKNQKFNQQLRQDPEFCQFVVAQKNVLADFLTTSFDLLNGVNTGSAQEADEPVSETATNIVPAQETPLVYSPSPVSQNSGTMPSLSNEQGSTSDNTADPTTEITQIFSEQTGYPVEMLEPSLDLEADLGIDTVKQMEILGIIRQKFGLELGEEFSLKQTPSIDAISKLVATC